MGCSGPHDSYDFTYDEALSLREDSIIMNLFDLLANLFQGFATLFVSEPQIVAARIGLMLLGMVLLLVQFDVLPRSLWHTWWALWPLSVSPCLPHRHAPHAGVRRCRRPRPSLHSYLPCRSLTRLCGSPRLPRLASAPS